MSEPILAEVPSLANRGAIYAISSPSGAGKSTIARKLLDSEPKLKLSISATTRQRRSAEVDGIDYHFISQAQFVKLKGENAFLEWAEVHGNYYGTPRAEVEARIAQGLDVLVDIDWQGAAQLAESCGDDLVRIFILPPSAEELHNRLLRRAQDAKEVIHKRLRNAVAELDHWSDYDYLIVNHDVQVSVAQAKAILAAERVRRQRQHGLADFVAELQAGLKALDLGD